MLVTASVLFAGGNTEAPEAEVISSGPKYISPNGDSIQDQAKIEFEVTVFVKSRDGYVPEYGIRLTDEDGTVVREIVERQESDLGWFLRLFRGFQAFTLTRSVPWDGVNDAGNQVDDGTYSVDMWVIAANEQRTDLELDSFVVDTQPPSVTVEIQSPAVFSPNNDGYLDTYEITQEDGTEEDEWNGRIVDVAGDAVKTYTWTSSAPETIVWDGIGDDGELVSDGVYSYMVESTDRAGNSFSTQTDTFEIDTTETRISVSLDKEIFSPNGDGAKDTLTVGLSQVVEEGILEWSLVIDDGKANVLRAYGESVERPNTIDPPESVEFDGKDEDGDYLTGGSYRAFYTLKYRNGNEVYANEPFVVDVTKPEISVTISEPRISPNGDGRKEKTEITFKSNEIVTWSGEIVDSDGDQVIATDSTRTTSLIVWNGRNSEDEVVEDGVYSIQATFIDRAGNSFSIEPRDIIVDTTKPQVTFELDKTYFSPDGDGIKDTVEATFTANEPVRGMLTLYDSSGRDVGTVGGFGRAYQFVEGDFSYEWNGISGSGLYVPDGEYTVRSTYEDRAGNRVELEEKMITVDTREVEVELSAPKGFSPNGDGRNDTITVAIDATVYDTVVSWTLEFVDGTGQTLRELEGEGTLPEEYTWDGSMQFTDSDVKTPEGFYTARLEAEYRKGDRVEAVSNSFFVDVTPPAVNVQATADPFARTNGHMEGDLFITLQIVDAHEVADWSLDVVTPDNEIVRSFTGTGDLQDQIVWKKDAEQISSVPLAERMIVKVDVIDEVGNSATFEQEVPLDILVVKRDGKLHLMVPNVIFGAYKYALDSRGEAQYRANIESIEKVIEIYSRYPRYRLLLEGHALNIYRGDEEKEAEEEEILVPLTENRAKTVRHELVERGMTEERIEVEWFGGTRPIVDVTDRTVRWKNRRVEFIMLDPDQE